MEDDIRTAAFLWLKERSAWNGGVFEWDDLVHGFSYQGRQVTLIGAKGIWQPKGFEIPISITTAHHNPYQDDFDADDFLEYQYRGTDPSHPDNVGLREAYHRRIPLIYFRGIRPGRYQAVWPIFILADDPKNLQVRAAIDPAYSELGTTRLDLDLGSGSELGVRRYVTALTRQRLHQSAFREFVLDAYANQCTMCRLQHTELLDAAHIIPDNQPKGDAVVQNGLSLCKIHHAAYDRNILGVSPDYVIRVREDVLREVDGPMLRYGLQSLEGTRLELPKRKADQPDRERLEIRYREFAS